MLEINQLITNHRDRLATPDAWLPYPLLIPAILFIILGVLSTIYYNHRLGVSIDRLNTPGESIEGNPIWLSVQYDDGKILVISEDRQKFHLSRDKVNVEEMNDFIHYLDGIVKKNEKAVSLQRRFDPDLLRVLIATSNDLSFAHIKSLLHALSAVGISHYSFETSQVGDL